MENCARYVELISLSLDGALSPEDARALAAHLVRCPDCMALYKDLTLIHNTMVQLPTAQPPADMTQRIMAALPKGKVVPMPSKKAFPWKRWAASAAAIAVVLLGAWGMSRADRTASPTADGGPAQEVEGLSPALENEADTTYGMSTPDPQPNIALFKTSPETAPDVATGQNALPEAVDPFGEDALVAENEEMAASSSLDGANPVSPSEAPAAAPPVRSSFVLTTAPTATLARTPVASPSRYLPIYCVEQEEKKLSISFDAAWGGENTSKLLEVLDEYDVKATFFLIGDWVDTYPDKVQEIADAGHEVMNHSSHHDHLAGLTSDEVIADVEACNDKVEAITGVRPTLIRLPYGDYDNNALSAIRSLGMEPIQWDVDSLDWKGISADEIVERVTSKAKSGSIILCHNSAEHTPEALPTILETLLDEGYTFVPISELILPGEYNYDYTIDGVGKQHPAE